MSVNVCPNDIFSVCLIMSAQYHLNHSTIFFLYQTWYSVYYDETMCHAEKLVHYFQCQGHSKGLYNQNMTFYYIFRTAGLFATKLGLLVRYYELECSVEKQDYCVQVKVTATVQNVSQCLSRRYLLNHRTFCYQT